ncbi:MAG: GCN5 family acetyltransferase [Desulfosporosinus sp. BRH_c37]|nr:MAG: GCN5 family acetyltransferase [Desulfosporosinus sp. BRH_c37]
MTNKILNHSIRRAKHSDISGMIRLLRILFSIETDFIIDEGTQQRGLEMMLEDCTNRYIMVAELNSQIIGMCTAQILVSTAEGGIVALIEDLVVGDVYRGQGIGKELLLAMESWAVARGVKRLQLLADRNNIRALEFYKRMSWKSTQMICLKRGTCEGLM